MNATTIFACGKKSLVQSNPGDDQNKYTNPTDGIFILVPWVGIEPTTLGLEVLCSIH